jgi:hypothetical protein
LPKPPFRIAKSKANPLSDPRLRYNQFPSLISSSSKAPGSDELQIFIKPKSRAGNNQILGIDKNSYSGKPNSGHKFIIGAKAH